jgi:hypothetical protein
MFDKWKGEQPVHHKPTRTPPSPYDALSQVASDEHPVDKLIARRCPQHRLRRQIRNASDDLLLALGKDRRTWLLVEELWNAYHAARERAYFDLGYEQGARIGRTEALRGEPSRKETRPLVSRIFQFLDEADLAPAARLSALLEAAWSLSAEPKKARQHVGPRRHPFETGVGSTPPMDLRLD